MAATNGRNFWNHLILLVSLIAVTTQAGLKSNGKKTILFVMTSNEKLGSSDHPTGSYLPEFAHPYNFLIKHYNIEFASPKGGVTPIDPGSRELFKADEECNAFLANEVAMNAINTTIPLEKINSKDYDAIFYPGGHGPMYDLTDHPKSQALAKEIYENGGLVSSVCHGTCALVNVKLSNGQYLIKGKKVTGFSNAEEDAVQMTKDMPFLLEDVIKERGGLYTKASELWGTHVLVDGQLVTGQNPGSSAELSQAIHKALSK